VIQAPDADSSFRHVLLDEAGVTSQAGARLFTCKAAFIAELNRQGEPLDQVRFVGEEQGSRAGARDDQGRGKADEPQPTAAVVM
jgi:hypothetical protein